MRRVLIGALVTAALSVVASASAERLTTTTTHSATTSHSLAAQPSCSATITSNTTLAADLANCPGDGIVIGADNITLDLNGHTIDGDGIPGDSALDVGIRNNGHAGVTIIGGTVGEFDRGIQLDGAGGNLLQHLKVMDNGGRGITLQNASNGNRIEFTNASNNLNRAGIAVISSDVNTVEHDQLDDNDVGVLLGGGAANNSVEDNTMTTNPGGGVVVLSSDENTVARNRMEEGGLVISGNHNLVAANLVTHILGCDDGCGIGISVEGGTSNRVVGNFVDHTARNGIRVDAYGAPAIGTILRANIVRSAGGDGLAVDTDQVGPVLDTTLEDNITIRSGHDGINVQSAATTLTRNLALHNGNLGLEAVAGVTDGGGNRAVGNGDPAQCTNVSCSP
jgi:parallel beta-helix repeat protein